AACRRRHARRPAAARLPDDVRLGHDAAGLDPAPARPVLGGRQHDRGQPGPRDVVPPPVPRRPVVALRAGVAVRDRRSRPGPGPGVPPGGEAGGFGGPGGPHPYRPQTVLTLAQRLAATSGRRDMYQTAATALLTDDGVVRPKIPGETKTWRKTS